MTFNQERFATRIVMVRWKSQSSSDRGRSDSRSLVNSVFNLSFGCSVESAKLGRPHRNKYELRFGKGMSAENLVNLLLAN